jgi:hypothetical protein
MFAEVEMGEDSRLDQIQSEIAQSSQLAQLDWPKRSAALERLESLGVSGSRRVAMYYARQDRTISRDDVLPFLNMLKSIGIAGDLDLIVQSPGGDGMAAEMLLDLCRKHCAGHFRVVVPLYAKSAATLLALGADEIVMGESSELGPIDAQVFIIQDNQVQQVSADHFLRARNEAMKELASGQPERIQAAQIQLALLSPAFLQHCEDLVSFSRDFAGKQLRTHMFRVEHSADPSTWDERIGGIVTNLTSSSKHLLHGRMITAQDIRHDDDLKHLKVRELDSNDPYWTALNELLLRTEIVLRSNNIGKILFARDCQLLGA